MDPVLLYDTTLRDGTQGENITFSADEKIKIALRLDDFGIDYIEGGWPGSNPKDMQFFDLAKRVEFRQARLVAFGATRKPGIQPAEDDNLKALIASKTPAVAIFGKSWDLHVIDVMNNSLAENLAMIHDSVTFLKDNGLEVVYDAEHFFDGYKNDADYALKTLHAAIDGGADFAVSAGGSTCWELAFMGLPALVIILADNQQVVAQGLDKAGAVVNLGWHHDLSVQQIAKALKNLAVAVDVRKDMIRQGRNLVDGKGIGRIFTAMGQDVKFKTGVRKR